MDLEEGSITGRELMIMVIGFILGSSLLFVPGQLAGHDAWLAVLAGLAEGLIIAFIITTLAERFSGISPIEYHDLIYGPIFGKIVSSMLMFFHIFLGSLVIRNFVNYFASEFLEETPTVVLAGFITFCCILAARNGIEVLARCSLVIVPMLLFAKLFDFLLLYEEMDFSYLRPVFEVKPVDFLRVVHSSAIFPFAECVSFLMVIPFLNREGKAKRAVIIALIVSGFILTLVAIRNVVVLGPLHDLSVYPSHLAIRQINIAHTISRVDILIAIDFLYMGFIKIAVLLYGAMLGIAQLFRLKDHRPLAYPLGIIMIAFSFSNFDSLIENLEFNKNMTPIVMTPFVFGIPFVSLVVAMLRGIPKKKGRRVKQSAREGEP